MFNKDHHYTIDRTVGKCILIKKPLSWFDLDAQGQGHRPVHPAVQNSVVLAMVFSNFMELSVIYISFSVIFVNFQ